MTAPENRLAVGRDPSGRFAKGVTGNPGGRPKGLASYIREQTRDGEDLVDKVLHILRHPRGKGVQAQKLQLECIHWLADRGFGKAVLNVEHTGMVAKPWGYCHGCSHCRASMVMWLRAYYTQAAAWFAGSPRTALWAGPPSDRNRCVRSVGVSAACSGPTARDKQMTLEPALARKVTPTYLRGDYDTAVFQALKEVEVRVRDGCGPS